MQLIHFLPQNELIHKHVECFHITNYEEKNLNHQVQIYPHYFIAVSIFAKASCLFNEDGFNIKEDENEKLKIVLLGGFTKPILAKVSGRIKSLSIVFKPTGLNYFTTNPFNELHLNPNNNCPFWTEKYDELVLLLQGLVVAAQMDLPPGGGNIRATISEEVGITSITLKYSRPAVKGRTNKIWGTLVANGFNNPNMIAGKNVSPWRA
jgi:hypothetical protein